MENFGFGHLNIKKMYVLKSMEKEFFHAFEDYLNSDDYQKYANFYVDDIFQDESQDLIEHIKEGSYKVKFCKGEFSLKNFSV